jgi:hydrogenase 3 maturation protease
MKKAFLAVGNSMMGDDGIASYLGKILEREKAEWKIFDGQDTPESEFHKLREYAPDMILVADAMTGSDIGKLDFIDLSDEINYMYTTHNLPMPVLLSYLRQFCKVVLFLGLNVDIEKVLEINPQLSQEAKNIAQKALSKIDTLDTLFEQK